MVRFDQLPILLELPILCLDLFMIIIMSLEEFSIILRLIIRRDRRYFILSF